MAVLIRATRARKEGPQPTLVCRLVAVPFRPTLVSPLMGRQGATVSNTGYIALVHKDHGTSYGVSFPDVPGCISAGDTFEEAIDNASRALAGHLAVMAADGDAMPKARSLEQLRGDAEFIQDAGDAVVAFVAPRADQLTKLQASA
jgi:predicted RNase H-like HicB family nuclease